MKITNAPDQIRPAGKPKAPLVFLKASRHPQQDAPLTMERIAANTARGVVTSFVPDTNVLIRMEDAANPCYPATDTTLAHFGILEFTNLLRECGRRNWAYSFSPMFAFSEMPWECSALSMQRYYAFGQRFGVHWKDDPSGTTYPALGRKGVPSIWQAPKDERAFIGLNYACSLLMLAIRKRGAARTPMQNFDLFLYELISQVQMFCARDAAVALYLFANSESYAQELAQICGNVLENFGKLRSRRKKGKPKAPRTFQAAEACALNAAYDLLLANFANLADTREVDGLKLDNWVVTGDGKLAVFMDICHNFNLGQLGPGAGVALTPQESPDGYMQEAFERIQWLSDVRKATTPSLPTPQVIDDMLHRVTARARAIWDGVAPAPAA